MREPSLLTIALLATLIGLICLSFIGCASSNLGRGLNVGVIASGVADLASTEYALAKGATEINPVMQEGPLSRAVIKAAGIGVVMGLTNLIDRKHPVLAHVVRGVVITGWSVVAIHNVKVTR